MHGMMANTAKLVNSEEVVAEIPAKVYCDIGKNTTPLEYLISELVDNTIASGIKNKKEKVNIVIKVSENFDDEHKLSSNAVFENSKFEYWDDAGGFDDIKKALLLSYTDHDGTQEEKLNHHGFGLKYAVSSMGGIRAKDGLSGIEVISKNKNGIFGTKGFKSKLIIDEYEYHNVFKNVDKEINEIDSGIYININNLNRTKFHKRKSDFYFIENKLRARYQLFLPAEENNWDDKPEIKINIIFILNDLKKEKNSRKSLTSLKPILSTDIPPRTMAIKGDEYPWEVILIYGFFAPESECEKRKIDYVTTVKHPYCARNFNKVDVFHLNRIINSFEIGYFLNFNNYESGSRLYRESYLRPYFKIVVTKGLHTAHNKTDFDGPEAEEFKSKIGKQIREIMDKKYGKKFTELEMRDKLKEMLEKITRKEFQKEVVIPICGGRIDLIGDKCAYELKREEVTSDALGQTLLYCVFGEEILKNCKEYIIIGPSINNQASNSLKELNERKVYDKSFRFMPYSDFGMNLVKIDKE